jgi:hypothetical protein
MRKYLFVICWIQAFLGWAVGYGDVVFSELMIDPEPVVGLPEAEYVELYNRSGQDLSLKGWSFHYGDKVYTFPAYTLNKGAYAVMCSKTNAALLDSSGPVIVFVSFPTLLNTGKLMYLVTDQGTLVACLDYSESWYGSDFKSNGGWSLECLDVDNLSGLTSNWTASENVNGGTPGCVNSVTITNPDETVPLCTGWYVTSPTTVELAFSKFMNPTALASTLNYVLSPEETLVVSDSVVFPDYRSVTLRLSDSLVSGETYELRLSGLTDVSDIPMDETVLPIGLPEKPESRSLSLNEVLFNPLAGGCDYVEFVNVSDKCVDLSQIWLTNRTSAGGLGDGVQLSEKPVPCVPGSYWLLSVSSDSVRTANGCEAIPYALDLTSFPSMPDDQGSVLLVSTSAEIIDEMAYSEKMHFALISDCEGVALEKVHPELASAESCNWLSAASSSGFGTPGSQNSQYRETSVLSEDCFSTQQSWMTPDNDGQNDRITIDYSVQEQSLGTLIIFDLQGRPLRTLAKNALLAASGSIFWDGTSDDGTLVSFGRYILHAEAFTPDGKTFRKRLVLTVLF